MVSPFCSNEREIMRVCGYIKDDRYIADYYGIPVSRVRFLRARVERPRRQEDRAFSNHGEPIDVRRAEDEHTSHMERGSQKLLQAIMNLLQEREKKSTSPLTVE